MSDLKHDLETVIHAIRGTGPFVSPKTGQPTSSAGVVATVAQRLSVERMTVYSYLKRWKGAKEALEEEREAILDLAENKLYKQVNDENMTAIIFLLKTRGKNRGYVEKSQVEHSGQVDVSKLSDDELRAIIEG